MLLPLFDIIICFIPLSSNIMNIFKDSLFSSSNKRKTKKTSQYQFRQANNSLTDPLLYTFENEDIELGTIDSDEESKLNNEHFIRTRHIRQNLAHGGGSIVIVEKSILPNETIQAFAIRYRVPVCLIYLFIKKNKERL